MIVMIRKGNTAAARRLASDIDGEIGLTVAMLAPNTNQSETR